ncbi:BatD family protein [Dokdonella sp.]|uniref:BatD family protein n=1 Tax=Dokdonella sp. TaxID=2291710 RepID=UPI003783DC76
MIRGWPDLRGWIAAVGMFVTLLAFADDKAGVRAWLDRDSMHLGETVTLNVEADGTAGGQPDFSALAADFNVLGTQSSQQVSIVNGTRSAKTLWAVGLEPKREGSITIAPISLGQAQTAPIHLSVLPAASAAQQAGGDLFLEASAEPLDPYVQQQVRYTVKLYYAFDLTDGNLGEPKADGLATQRIGQDKQYIATVGTRRYHVLERHYALTPERSGTIGIPALAFRGSVLDASDPAAFFGRGRSVSARSDALKLEVKPKPAAWTQPTWLPAASLLLQDQGELPTEVHVGEPVTRTIRMQAQGLGYEQLPELQLSAPEGAKIYPDKAETRTRDDGEWLYGERVRKFAFVPDRAGTLSVPGVTVTWWDTTHDRLETAELPARTIKVLPAAGAASQAAPTAGGAVAPLPANVNGLPAGASTFNDASRIGLWKMIAVIGFMLWVATLLAWWASRRVAGLRPLAPVRVPKLDSNSQRAAFLRACALGDLAGAERALVAWARNERAEVRNLGELCARLADDAQRNATSALQRARYAGESSDGLAARLQKAFGAGIAWVDAPARAASTTDPLPPLYPTRD